MQTTGKSKNSTMILPIFIDAFGYGKHKLSRVLQYAKDFLTTHMGLKSTDDETERPLLNYRSLTFLKIAFVSEEVYSFLHQKVTDHFIFLNFDVAKFARIHLFNYFLKK